MGLEHRARQQILESFPRRADQLVVLSVLGVEAVHNQLGLLAAILSGLGGGELTPVRARGHDHALRFEQGGGPALAFKEVRKRRVGLLIVRDGLGILVRLRVVPGAGVERPDDVALGRWQIDQPLQQRNPGVDGIGIHGSGRGSLVLSQQTRRIAKVAGGLRARREIEQHCRVVRQGRLQLFQLRADTGTWRLRRRVVVIIIIVGVSVSILENEVVQPRNLRAGGGRDAHAPITGRQRR